MYFQVRCMLSRFSVFPCCPYPCFLYGSSFSHIYRLSVHVNLVSTPTWSPPFMGCIVYFVLALGSMLECTGKYMSRGSSTPQPGL
ncbi:hypothetical protein EDC04DRAFT_2655914 [Pisolithus marmoratus]|nr:hypothetical protein EDC04DRAFT_2655914 [Pisolithus marmoratus]